ncbi:metallophosphoesterase [Roseobacteraceae bacterium NS-SX3]
MLKFIWMSDLHFASGGDVLGHDPRVRLDAAITHINRHHADAAFCVISGDMVETAAAAEYAALAERLRALAIPCFPMVGNHDDRVLLRESFPLPAGCMDDFVQYTVETSSALIVNLDTQKTGSGGGEFCPERARWLAGVLDAAGDTPVLLFLHHPPMPLGLPMQDSERMEGGARFLDLLEGRRNVKHLCIGHVHRPITGAVRGIPFATMRSVLYQAPAPQPEWDWESFCPSAEAPELGVVSVGGEGVTIQYHQFCAYEAGTAGQGAP